MSRQRPPAGAGLITAVGFLTRVPVPFVDAPESGEGDGSPNPVTAAVPWFPIVGLAIGAAQGAVYLGLASVAPPLVAAAVAVAAALLTTGAFHHDGLADIADAFGGGWTREQRLEILKDSRLGTYGTAALTIALIIEVAAIGSLDPFDGFRVLIAAQCLSRVVAVSVMWLSRHRPADDTPGADAVRGLGATYTADLTAPPIAVSVIVSLAISAAVSPDPVAVAVGLVAAAIAAAAVVLLARSKIGAVNGDVLGAIQVLSMAALLVAASAVLVGPA